MIEVTDIGLIQYFLKAYRLNDEYLEENEFKREEFINELGDEFLAYIRTTPIGRDSKHFKLYYYRFREIVKLFENLFWEISRRKRNGIPFTKNLWKCFYASYVVKTREAFYPDLQRWVEKSKYYRSKQDKKYTAQNGNQNHRPTRQYF